MLYAAVLAGGRSSRMGQDKSQLLLHGQTLLERAILLLRGIGADVLLVSGGHGHDHVPDLLPECGPAGAVYSLLDRIRERHGLDGSPLLLIPVDMPLLTEGTIRHLLDVSATVQCCHYAGEVFPCVLKTTPDLWMHLCALFTGGTGFGSGHSMNAILNRVGATEIPSPEHGNVEFRNVNTPEEWQAVCTQLATSAKA
jgi:molybdenum cofactor guanylyltransferase